MFVTKARKIQGSPKSTASPPTQMMIINNFFY